MEKITFECEVLTPMFLAGAKQESFELRPPSLKGALRFWWRAMHGNSDNLGNLDLETLKKDETEIFGGGGEDARKSSFAIIHKANKIIQSSQSIFSFKKIIADNPKFYRKDIKVSPIEYLGFGPYFKNKWKPSIAPGSKFSIELLFYNPKFISDVTNAFLLLSNFGGLGSKAHNGFGNFKIINIKTTNGNKNIDIQNILNNINISSPNLYQFFSTESKIYKVNQKFDYWQETLNVLGNVYRLSRVELDKNKYEYYWRVKFATPTKGAKREEIFERKSKHIFIHVNKTDDGKYEGQILTMPIYKVNDSTLKKLKLHNLTIKNLSDELKKVDEKFNELIEEHFKARNISFSKKNIKENN